MHALLPLLTLIIRYLTELCLSQESREALLHLIDEAFLDEIGSDCKADSLGLLVGLLGLFLLILIEF